jgi:hypothetical protein
VATLIWLRVGGNDGHHIRVDPERSGARVREEERKRERLRSRVGGWKGGREGQENVNQTTASRRAHTLMSLWSVCGGLVWCSEDEDGRDGSCEGVTA